MPADVLRKGDAAFADRDQREQEVDLADQRIQVGDRVARRNKHQSAFRNDILTAPGRWIR